MVLYLGNRRKPWAFPPIATLLLRCATDLTQSPLRDDITIPDEAKQPLLCSFLKHTVAPGWNFNGCGPNEKDRQLLVEYHTVVEELNPQPAASVHFHCHMILLCLYKDIIVEKMQIGNYKPATYVGGGTIYLLTTDYDLYRRYSAGLVLSVHQAQKRPGLVVSWR